MAKPTFLVDAAAMLLMAGCATKEAPVESPAPASVSTPTPEPVPVPEAEQTPALAKRGDHGTRPTRKLRPMAVKPISVKADCSYRDPTGYGGTLNLLVENSQVRTLQADIQVPKRGSCAFALKDFRQTTREPSVTLASASGACTVRLWEQEGKVTVAFNSCKDRCQGDSFDYVWPILVDARTGKCS